MLLGSRMNLALQASTSIGGWKSEPMERGFEPFALTKRYLNEIRKSGLSYVVSGYSILIVLNLITFALGPLRVYKVLDAQSWGILTSFAIFDSWPTVLGLAGTVVIFTIALIEMRKDERLRLSGFFVLATITSGPIAEILWNGYYNSSDLIPFGSSSVALSAEGVTLTVCIFGLMRIFRQEAWRIGSWTKRRCLLSVLIFSTIAASALVYILALQPIFIPTTQYNWRVHEISFLLGTLSAVAYLIVAMPELALAGKVILLDERLMNFRYLDLNDELFHRVLPEVKMLFKDLPNGLAMESHPRSCEIWVSQAYKNREFHMISYEFDQELLEQMRRLQQQLLPIQSSRHIGVQKSGEN